MTRVRGAVARLEPLAYDTRLALRALSRAPGFCAATVLTLSLAIALNATAFRVLDTVLLRGQPLVKDSGRVLYIDEQSPNAGCCVSYFDFAHWRREAHAFQEMAFMAPRSISLAEGNGDGRTVWADAWTVNVFRLTGVSPILGRAFEAADAVPGAPPVVIASYRYWQNRLGGRRDIVGQSVRIDGVPATVVGVMPDGFEAPAKKDVWLPLTVTAELEQRVLNGGIVYGRLAPGATEAQARAELEAIDERLGQEYPDSNRGVRPSVNNYRESRGLAAQLFYGSLWLGAWFVLAIAFANAANLALGRAQARSRELSARAALGAPRLRLARALFLEHLALAAIAGLCAAWLASAAIGAWSKAAETPYLGYEYTPTPATTAYLMALTLAAAVVATLAPVAHLWRLDVSGSLQGESRGATASLRAKRISRLLVAVQMALAVVLIAGAGVLGRSVWNIVTADIGVQTPERVLMGNIGLPRERYRTAESRSQFFEALQARLSALPGVESAAISNGRPVDDFEPRAVEIEGHAEDRHPTPIFVASPGYFRTLGAAVAAGRDFTAADRRGAAQVALINQRFAAAHFPNENPIGRRIRVYDKYHVEPGEWRTIVGVVSNVMQNEASRQEFRPVAYVPFAQQPTDRAWFFARTTSVWDGLAAAVRNAVAEIDPRLEVADYSTLKASLGLEFESTRMMGGLRDLSKNAMIAPVYASLALLLAVIGLYAVVARSVAQRRTELGIRMALGASPWAIRRLVLAEGMAPVAVGLALGVVASFGINRILRAQLVGVAPDDALTLCVAAVILVAVAFVGCLRPARSAVRVDPAVALRQD